MKPFLRAGLVVLLITPIAVAVSGAHGADPRPPASDPATTALLDRSSLTPAQRKLATPLLAGGPAAANAATAAATDATATAATANDATTDRTAVDITADVDDGLLALITASGGTVVSSYPQYDAVRADLPTAAIEAVAADARVRAIVPAEVPVTHAITSEGDATHAVPAVRAQFNAKGQGVRVGVLSDGIDGGTSAELPAVSVLAGQLGSGSEGRAMLEIIHDLAPDAELYFASALGGRATMAANILALAEAGCTVLVDDIGYLSEPPFQDGIIAQAISAVTAAGVTYLSAAGNGGRLSGPFVSTWEGDVQLSTDVVVAGTYHDFDPGPGEDSTAGIAGLPGTATRVTLAWNDPDGASANDYDLVAVDGAGQITTVSLFVQDGNDLAFELLDAPVGTTAVKVLQRPGAAARFLHLAVANGRLTEWATTGSTYGHAAASDTISVGATAAAAAEPPGVDGPFPNPFTAANQPEIFSADGPRRMFYDPAGNPLTPGDLTATGGTVLQKPDLLAADGVSTSTPGFIPFYGTSAAAPHAAAIAALVRSARPDFTAAQVRAALVGGTLDLAPAGWDLDSGFGILSAPLALQQADPPLPDDFVSFVPQRILETRPDLGQVGYSGPKPVAGQTIVLPVTGVTTPAVPGAATAVALNVTGTGATFPGFVTVWPCDAPRPLASNLNLTPGDTRANLVISKISAAGTVCLFTLQGADLVADIAGYLPPTSRFTPLVPERLLETRPPDLVGYTGRTPAAGQVVRLQVTGAGASNVPSTASAVALNVTAVDSVAPGFVTVWPCDADLPTASNLNLVPGVITPNLVISKLSADGAVCLFTQLGGHLLADISGYFESGPNGYVPVVPNRLLDTRSNVGAPNEPSAGRVIELTVTGGAANVPTDATAVALNVTGTDVVFPGFVTVWPCGAARPTASNLNLAARQTRPNLVLADVGADGKVCLFTQQPASLVADLVGWFP